MISGPRDIDLEEIQTYDSALMTHDFIPTTTEKPSGQFLGLIVMSH
jgi:hypothetical protein